MDDNEIIKLYQSRSEQAISETSGKYGKYCHYIAYNILRNQEDASECVNDAYLNTWNAIPPACPTNLQTFLGKITRNLAINKLEKAKAKKRGAGQSILLLDELSECIPDNNSQAQITDSLVIKDVLNSFLANLPKETRQIFIRRYWYLSSIKEIAKDYGLSESKVTVTLFRTREKLKTVLEKEGILL